MLVSISIVVFSMISSGYHTLCIVTWIYGLGLGGYRCELIVAFRNIRVLTIICLSFEI